MSRILIIENDDSCRDNWRELLSLLKYDIETAHQINNMATRGISRGDYIKSFDLIVGDADTVGLDALELKGILNNDFDRIPLILVSTDNVPEYSLDREELSAVSFLRKPFENSLLLEYVSKALKTQALLQKNTDAQKAIAKLLINQPPRLPQEIALKRSYTLGRYRDSDEVHADIRLASPSASRKHAFLIRIYKGAASYYKLIDFSSNGIQINGQRMGRMARLNHGDEIQFYPGCRATYTEIAREENDLDVTLTS